jgi:NADPH:quinone reductase-like Zn-dependent oxidoreductase
MKAIIWRKYGAPDLLRLEELAPPTPRPGEVLVRNRATVVTAAESAMRSGNPAARLYAGLFTPRFRLLGSTFAGTVAKVTDGDSRFAIDDTVFGDIGPQFGALAQFAVVGDKGTIVRMPPGMSFTDAAALYDGAFTALPFLRDHAKLRPGQSILVNGASGAVGSAAVQLAKHLGAEVTAVSSARNHELVISLGADHVIDYETEDFTKRIGQFDVIFDAIGKSSFSRGRRALTSRGIYLTTVPSVGILVHMLVTSKSKGRRAAIAFTGLRPAANVASDLAYIIDLAQSGEFVPVIDRTYTLEQAAEAHAYVDTARKRGSVIVTLD